ncbi:hypothetical protein CJU90_4148 [Yarrowia sp. C11]|nr:hypothetical protein CKK34_6764 [Yarrowia sp. E02]KAG5365088.1 hypothetical protein CJU90_4148 [Yarrowia sp. C11]
MDPEQNGLNGAHLAADKTTETVSNETLVNHDSTDTAVASTQETNGDNSPGSKRQGEDLETPPPKREKIPSLKLRLSLSSQDSTPPSKKSTKKDSTKNTPKKDTKKDAKKATPKKATPKKPAATKKETPKKATPKKTAASKAKAAAAAEETAVKSEPNTAESTPVPSTPTKTVNGKKAAPCPPKFQILLSDYPEYVIWGRLQIREFLIRFNDIISIGSRHGPSLNDLTGPWNEFMYKHIITALMSVLTKDYAVHAKLPPSSNNAYNHPGPPMDKEVHMDLAKQIERIPAESERLWLMLSDYIEIANEKLGDIDPVVGKTELKESDHEEEMEETKTTSREVQKLGELSTELDYERRSIDLVGRLITLVASTEQVRNALTRDNDQREASYAETVKNLNVQWYKKREELKQSRPNGAGKGRAALYEWQDIHAVAKNAWIESVEQAKYAVIMGNRHKRHRMQPVGKDHLGNTYWVCQERLTGVRDLSSFIIIEKAEESEYPVPMQELTAYNEAHPPKPKKKKPVKKAAPAPKEEGEEGDEVTAAEDVVMEEEEEEEEDDAPPLLPDPNHEFYHFSLNTSRPLLGANQNTTLYMVTCKEDGELLAKWLPYHMGEKDPTKPPNERDKFIQRIKQVSEIMLPRELIAT